MYLKKFRDIKRPEVEMSETQNGNTLVTIRRDGKQPITCQVQKRYTIEQIVWMKNGCHPGRPVILTVHPSPTNGRKVYSAQCACDFPWCTTGRYSPEEALDHYKRMTEGENLYLPEGYIL